MGLPFPPRYDTATEYVVVKVFDSSGQFVALTHHWFRPGGVRLPGGQVPRNRPPDRSTNEHIILAAQRYVLTDLGIIGN